MKTPRWIYWEINARIRQFFCWYYREDGDHDWTDNGEGGHYCEVCYGIVKETGLEAPAVVSSRIEFSAPDLATRVSNLEKRLNDLESAA